MRKHEVISRNLLEVLKWALPNSNIRLKKRGVSMTFSIYIIHDPITSRFSSNSEAYASELPENLEEMFSAVQIFNHTLVCFPSRKVEIGASGVVFML